MSQKNMIKAGLVGVTGYTGMELARILAAHPDIRLSCVTSRSEAGQPLKNIYPFLHGFEAGELLLVEPDAELIARECELAFLAVPHGAAMDMAGQLRSKGLKVVDLSADFRLKDPDCYRDWYNLEHREKARLGEAVYGLPELYADKVRGASLVANPGCYPTASILGLYPALKAGMIDKNGIIIDAKSGTSGAGRKASVPTLFTEVYDNFRPYGMPLHRHTPEIEQELSSIAGAQLTVSFNPHLLPINRGILATIYTALKNDLSPESIHEHYKVTYREHRFVRVLPMGKLPELRNVRGSMFCDIALVKDERNKRLIILSAIDNLCRGASGQAVANANLMYGLPLERGLSFAPMVP